MDATENGVLVSFGRLNTTDQKEVALLSSSTKSNLYFKVMTTDSSKTKSVENTFTVVTTNDLTEGFHTIVVAYTPAFEVLNGAGSFDIYCDGVLVRTVSTDTPKLLGGNVGKFYVDAATNAVVTLTVGSGGSFKATSEAIVRHGVLKPGSATALGTTPKITGQEGGTFDINGTTIRPETPIYIAGAGSSQSSSSSAPAVTVHCTQIATGTTVHG